MNKKILFVALALAGAAGSLAYYFHPAKVSPVAETDVFTQEATSTIESSRATSSRADSFGPMTKYFEAPPSNREISGVTGYFARGAFFTYLPGWMSEGWAISPDGSDDVVTFYPRDSVGARDFSDIVMTFGDSTESFNSNWLFESERATYDDSVLQSEVILSDGDNLRIYHIEKSIGEDIADVYYIDGNGKTMIVRFSSSKRNYYYYGPKIKEFLRGLTLSKGPRG
jgi:transglutaminase-like putative cysteine protease